MMKSICLSVWIVFVLNGFIPQCSGNRGTGRVIAARAREMIGSTRYPFSSSFWDKMVGEPYKGHLFVADVLKSVGVLYPKRKIASNPINADEWADTQSGRMNVFSMCWKVCAGGPVGGDILAFDGVVGIVTGSNRFTYSNPFATPPGLITEVQPQINPQKRIVCWRYIC